MACNAAAHIIPVLQDYTSETDICHTGKFGNRLPFGMCGGGESICKRNGDPCALENVLLAIKEERPDLQLHGFGVKAAALGSVLVRQ